MKELVISSNCFNLFVYVSRVSRPGAGPCRRNRIGSLYDAGDQRLRLNIAMMCFHRIHHNAGLLILPAELCSDLDVGALHLMVN